MKEWKARAGICALLAFLVAVEGGCWGRKFFRMPAETLATSAKVDSLLRENAILRERISVIEQALKENRDFARGTNAQLKMDLEELKDQLNELQETMRDAEESSSFRPAERRKAGPADTTRSKPPAATGNRSDAASPASGVSGGDTIGAAPGVLAMDSLSALGGATDTVGGLAAPVPPPEELYRQIYLDFNRREYQAALEESESFLVEYPDDPLGEEVLFIRGECLMEQTVYMDALREFSTILQRYPDGKRVPGALLRMAIAYDSMGQTEVAAGVARRLVREYPRSEEAKAAEERFGAVIKQ
ncbi:MAG: tetratricopeptide repeat protein [Candidatus Krumholzibacteria bacterium]|nr:tetratricopeptide repeat protein [Candidatus Krumholzibacteria bacterium]